MTKDRRYLLFRLANLSLSDVDTIDKESFIVNIKQYGSRHNLTNEEIEFIWITPIKGIIKHERTGNT